MISRQQERMCAPVILSSVNPHVYSPSHIRAFGPCGLVRVCVDRMVTNWSRLIDPAWPSPDFC